MDKQFDELSKSLVEVVSRREALRKFGLTIAGLGILCFAAFRPAIAQTYTVTALAQISDGSFRASSKSINASGQVIVAEDYLWTPSSPNGTTGSLTALSTLPIGSATSVGSQGSSINASGQIAGTTTWLTFHNNRRGYYYYSVTTAATFWQGGTAPAQELDSGGDSFANGINDNGDVVGTVNGRATIWHNGKRTGLTGNNSSANAINNIGQIVGQNSNHASLWQNGKVYDLGVLPAYNSGSTALAVNASGMVVGYAWNINITNAAHAFLWTPSAPNGTAGQMVDLGALPGAESAAYGVNASGQVVGAAANGSGGAFLWDSVHGMRSLNSLLPAGSAWTLYTAFAINDKGQIVGGGQFTDATGDHDLAFLLTPQ